MIRLRGDDRDRQHRPTMGERDFAAAQKNRRFVLSVEKVGLGFSMLRISRRDFLNGMALAIASGLTPGAQLAAAAARHPPALTGLRGQHPGSFEVAHALARAGVNFHTDDAAIEESYDLVVVGGGISGLAAAWFYRRAAGPDARILACRAEMPMTPRDTARMVAPASWTNFLPRSEASLRENVVIALTSKGAGENRKPATTTAIMNLIAPLPAFVAI